MIYPWLLIKMLPMSKQITTHTLSRGVRWSRAAVIYADEVIWCWVLPPVSGSHNSTRGMPYALRMRSSVIANGGLLLFKELCRWDLFGRIILPSRYISAHPDDTETTSRHLSIQKTHSRLLLLRIEPTAKFWTWPTLTETSWETRQNLVSPVDICTQK